MFTQRAACKQSCRTVFGFANQKCKLVFYKSNSKIMKFCFTLFFLLYSFSAFANWNDCIIGNYEYKEDFNKATFLSLDEDFTFSNEVQTTTCTEIGFKSERFEGKYVIEGNKVIFYPSKCTKINVTEFEEDTVKTVYDKSIHTFRDTLFVVYYDENIFLLSNQEIDSYNHISKETDFMKLYDLINGGKQNSPNSFFWTKKNNCDLPSKSVREQLPKEWKDYLLDTFLDAKVIKMEIVDGMINNKNLVGKNKYEGTKSIVTIDKGKNAGVKEGMKFYVKNIEDYGIRPMKVWYVTETTSIMQSIYFVPAQLKIGTELTTKSDKEILIKRAKERYLNKKK